MAELIRKDKLIAWSYREPTYYDSMNDRTDMRDFINNLPTTSEAEIRASVVDEFAEKLKKEAYDKEYNVWTKDTMISIWGSTIDEIAEQIKEVNEDDGTGSYAEFI